MIINGPVNKSTMEIVELRTSSLTGLYPTQIDILRLRRVFKHPRNKLSNHDAEIARYLQYA